MQSGGGWRQKEPNPDEGLNSFALINATRFNRLRGWNFFKLLNPGCHPGLFTFNRSAVAWNLERETLNCALDAMGKDRLTKERRSWNMSRIRGKDTTPEKIVRSILYRLGYRFRLHARIPILYRSHKTFPTRTWIVGEITLLRLAFST